MSNIQIDSSCTILALKIGNVDITGFDDL